MNKGILSIVIVQNDRGYIASLRFADSSKDADMASNSKYLLYEYIENYVVKAGCAWG